MESITPKVRRVSTAAIDIHTISETQEDDYLLSVSLRAGDDIDYAK